MPVEIYLDADFGYHWQLVPPLTVPAMIPTLSMQTLLLMSGLLALLAVLQINRKRF